MLMRPSGLNADRNHHRRDNNELFSLTQHYPRSRLAPTPWNHSSWSTSSHLNKKLLQSGRKDYASSDDQTAASVVEVKPHSLHV
jgi:hypothetical protein